jgi:hypothetical protein
MFEALVNDPFYIPLFSNISNEAQNIVPFVKTRQLAYGLRHMFLVATEDHHPVPAFQEFGCR